MSRFGVSVYNYNEDPAAGLWEKKNLVTQTNEGDDNFLYHADNILQDYGPDAPVFDFERSRDTSTLSKRIMNNRYNSASDIEHYVPDLCIEDNGTEGQWDIDLSKGRLYTASQLKSRPMTQSSDDTVHEAVKTTLDERKDMISNRMRVRPAMSRNMMVPLRDLTPQSMMTPQYYTKHKALNTHIKDGNLVEVGGIRKSGPQTLTSEANMAERKNAANHAQTQKIRDGKEGFMSSVRNDKIGKIDVQMTHKSREGFKSNTHTKYDLAKALENLTSSRRETIVDHKSSYKTHENGLHKTGIVQSILNMFDGGERSAKRVRDINNDPLPRRNVELMTKHATDNVILDHKVLTALEKEGHIKKNASDFIKTNSTSKWESVMDSKLKYSREISGKLATILAPTHRSHNDAVVEKFRSREYNTPSKAGAQLADPSSRDRGINTQQHTAMGTLTRLGAKRDTKIHRLRTIDNIGDNMVF